MVNNRKISIKQKESMIERQKIDKKEINKIQVNLMFNYFMYNYFRHSLVPLERLGLHA